MAEGGPNDCELQKNEVAALLKSSLKKGDTWYLIDTKWFKQWKKFVGFDSWDTSFVGDQCANPGPIDNSPLFKAEGSNVLKERLIDELDYMLVPTEAWNKLVGWYSIVEGQEPLDRKVIEQGYFTRQLKVEVYPLEIKLCENSNMDTCISRNFSRADTIDYIEKEMRNLFKITNEKEVRLWNKYMSNTYEHLNKPDNTVQDAGLFQGQIIVIEQMNDDGSWPRQTKMTNSAMSYSSNAATSLDINSCSSSPSRSSSTYNSHSSGYGSSSSTSNYYNYSSYDSYSGSRGSALPGICGLSNLGNTCFMNSAIQCMSNVPPLTEYFQNKNWRNELNHDNPLGMKGEIATNYAELVDTVWSGQYSYTVPRNFKIAVGRFAPQFSGYQQHDSQEFMAFFLDGLHEDLNRIKKKPYIELNEREGQPDEEIAKEAWINYRKRNDSIIVDTFHGLLKSTLVCPECQKVSITFDPFCYLSLPLPIKKERQIEVFLVRLDPASKTRQYKLTVPKLGTVVDLCTALSKLTDIPFDKMVVTDVYGHRFHKVFGPDEGLNHILDRDDIFIYEVPVTCVDDPDTLILPVYMRERRVRQSYNNHKHESTQLFGQPMLVPVPRKSCTYDVLYNAVLNKMARYVHVPEDSDEWWKEDSAENGEVEMNNSEEDETDASGENSTRKGQDGYTDADDEEHTLVNGEEKKHRLFTFHMINSYGSAEMDQIHDDGRPIKFSNRSYVAMDWNALAKEKFYDSKLVEEIEVDESVNNRPVQKKQVIQLDECLQLFTTTEKLGSEDPWYCPRCKKHQQATKKFDLWSLPPYLVIHLKRFSYNRYWRDKLDTFVEFPTSGLRMEKYLINKCHGPSTYDLIAVTNHYGGMGGGHYTAFAKNKDDGHWYNFDDSSVTQTSEDAAVTRAGYVLVYQRRDLVNSGNRNAHRNASAASGVPDKEGNYSGANGDYHNSDNEMDIN